MTEMWKKWQKWQNCFNSKARPTTAWLNQNVLLTLHWDR